MPAPNELRRNIAARPNQRPYAARVTLELGEDSQIQLDGDCCALTAEPLHVLLEPTELARPSRPRQRIVSKVEGLPTAGEAELKGLQLTRGWLWVAISLQCPVRLTYHTPLPCVVYDRTQGLGFQVSGQAYFTVRRGIGRLVDLLDEGMALPDPDNKLLLAMELFAAAQLEVTTRARFIGMVSALEPLADPKRYEAPVISLVEELLLKVQASTIDLDTKRSLEGRVRHLRSESINRALRRLFEQTQALDPVARDVLSRAYELRSELLHSGRTDRDLSEWLSATEAAMRTLFSAVIGKPLAVPATIIAPVA